MVTPITASSRQLRRQLAPLVERAAATPGADRYRKRFPALAHLWLLLLHVLWQSPSLRITHARLSSSRRWWQRWGMSASISFSQLARSSTSRSSECLETLLSALLTAARRQAGRGRLAHPLPDLAALDSTFLRLSACLSPWSVYGAATPGVRLQGLLDLGRALPERLRLDLADVNDHNALLACDLRPWQGWTLLFDRGYYGHRSFARLRAAGVQFITRLNQQASYRVSAVHALLPQTTADGDVLLSDWTVSLGSAHNRRGTVIANLRLVRSRNPQGQVQDFLTSRHDLSAAQVVMLYRRRWRIELFFRWLKHQLGLLRPLGYSRAAVWLTLLLLVAVAVIAQLLTAAQPPGFSRVAWLSYLAFTLFTEIILDG
jgi:hypothetical protein